MTVVEFFNCISGGPQKWPAVSCFTSKKQYPLHFFSYMRMRITALTSIPVQVIDLEKSEMQDVERTLTATFLGESFWYWLQDSTVLDLKKRERLFLFLQQYKGPHRILFFMQLDDKALSSDWSDGSIQTVELSDQIVKYEAQQVAEWLSFCPSPAQVVDYLYAHTTIQTFDDLCMGLLYITVAGKSRAEFARDWLDLILEPQTALFTLSTHFFAKKSRLFFQSWLRIKDQYSMPFWTTFWLEQMWRACFYVQLMRAGDRIEAKKVSFRLPFSFINTDWKRYTATELRAACDQLYGIELHIKQGADGSELDLFLSQFLVD